MDAIVTNADVSTRRKEGDESEATWLRHFQAVREAFQLAGVGFAKGADSQISITFQGPVLRLHSNLGAKLSHNFQQTLSLIEHRESLRLNV